MNCPKCNYDNADNALFCANCGAKLESPSAYSPVEAAPTNSAADPSAQLPVYGAQNTAQDFPSYTQPAQQSYGEPAGYSADSYPVQNYGSGYNAYNGAPLGQPQRDWAAITALVCGILSLPCCFTVYGGVVVGLCAVVFGILGIKSTKKAMAIVGLCLGAVGLICSIIMAVTVFSMMSDPSFMNEFMTEFENAMNV